MEIFNSKCTKIYTITLVIYLQVLSAAEKKAIKPIWKNGDESNVEFYCGENEDLCSAHITNTTYLYKTIFKKGSSDRTRYIIKQKSIWDDSEAREGKNPKLIAEGFLFDNKKSLNKIWTIKEDADISEYHSEFYKLIQYGCCSMANNHKYYSIESGKIILESTEKLINFEVPNSKLLTRFVGYKASETYQTYEYEKDSLHVGSLTLATAADQIDKIIFTAVDDSTWAKKFGFGHANIKFDGKEPKFKMQNENTFMQIWINNDEKTKEDISGFNIKIHFYMEEIPPVLIPVKSDKFDIEKFRHPDFKISRIK